MLLINHDLNTWPLEVIENIVERAPLYEQGCVISCVSKKFELANAKYKERASQIFNEIKISYKTLNHYYYTQDFRTGFTTEQRIQLFSLLGKSNLFNELHDLELGFKFTGKSISDFFCINWNSDNSENLKINNQFGNLRIKCFFESHKIPSSVHTDGKHNFYTGDGSDPTVSLTSYLKFTQQKLGSSSWITIFNSAISYIVNTAMNVELNRSINAIAEKNLKYFSFLKTMDDLLDVNAYFCDSKGAISLVRDTCPYNFYIMIDKTADRPFLRWTTDDLKEYEYSSFPKNSKVAIRWNVFSKTSKLLAKQLKIDRPNNVSLI